MVKTLLIGNIKGGVGKTTTAIGLAGAFSELDPDFKILLVDCDTSGNLSRGFGYTPDKIDDDKGIKTLFQCKKIPLKAVIQPTKIENIFIVTNEPSTREIFYDPKLDNFLIIKKFEQFQKESKNNWLVIFDTRPDMDLLSFNALIASERVLIPMDNSEYSLDGFDLYFNMVKYIQMKYNPKLGVIGVFRNRWEKAHSLLVRDIEVVLEHYKDCLFESIIPASTSIPESYLKYHVPINYRDGHKNVDIYKNLAKEVLKKWEKRVRIV